MITRENVSNADATRALGPEVLTCPDCGHGIDPHGTDPGGPCGVSRCPCLLQPNGIACLLIEARVREARFSAVPGPLYNRVMGLLLSHPFPAALYAAEDLKNAIGASAQRRAAREAEESRNG